MKANYFNSPLFKIIILQKGRFNNFISNLITQTTQLLLHMSLILSHSIQIISPSLLTYSKFKFQIVFDFIFFSLLSFIFSLVPPSHFLLCHFILFTLFFLISNLFYIFLLCFFPTLSHFYF